MNKGEKWEEFLIWAFFLISIRDSLFSKYYSLGLTLGVAFQTHLVKYPVSFSLEIMKIPQKAIFNNFSKSESINKVEFKWLNQTHKLR